jgi:hypothetical protein
MFRNDPISRKGSAMRSRFLLCFIFIIASFSQAQQKSPTAPALTKPIVHRGDIPDLTRDTQLSIKSGDYIGLLWWIPTDFWARSAETKGGDPAKTANDMQAINGYTVVFAFAAKVGSLGQFDFVSPQELEQNIVIRDSEGNEYAALSDITDGAKNLAGIIKPMLANAMGKAGENSTMMFFPGKTKAGLPMADPKVAGSLRVVIKNVVGVPEDIYEWKTPLTSFVAPVYCPIGKEQLNANWKFCPWHGVQIGAPAVAKDQK